MAADAGCDGGTGALTISDVVQSGPSAAAFTSVGTFYAADGATVMNCSTFSDTNYPSFVKVESTGTINGSPNRTIETYVRLTPNFGGFGAAILGGQQHRRSRTTSRSTGTAATTAISTS